MCESCDVKFRLNKLCVLGALCGAGFATAESAMNLQFIDKNEYNKMEH